MEAASFISAMNLALQIPRSLLPESAAQRPSRGRTDGSTNHPQAYQSAAGATASAKDPLSRKDIERPRRTRQATSGPAKNTAPSFTRTAVPRAAAVSYKPLTLPTNRKATIPSVLVTLKTRPPRDVPHTLSYDRSYFQRSYNRQSMLQTLTLN